MTIFFPYFPIFLSLSLSFLFSFILPTLVNLFKNNIHSFLGFPGVLGLLSAVRHVKTLPNPNIVLDPKPPPPMGDPGGIGFLHHFDGITSCTESLGFESSDERRLDDHNEKDGGQVCRTTATVEGEGSWRKMGNHVKKEVKSFPPPISSLNRNGQPCFFLRPLRKDGRLELTEVRIHRPECLHVSRHDGRLTLHLIPDESILDGLEEEEEEEEEGLEEEEEEERREDEEDGEVRLRRCEEVAVKEHTMNMCGVITARGEGGNERDRVRN